MRVIAGEYRRRVLKSLAGSTVRPTPDRLKESLFSILGSSIEGIVFLDAYAGSGAVGIEAISRGCRRSIFFERDFDAYQVMRENVKVLGIGPERATTIRGKAAALYALHPADIVFIDPPYDSIREYEASLAILAGLSARLVLVQHPAQISLQQRYGTLDFTRQLKQGTNLVSFFSRVIASV